MRTFRAFTIIAIWLAIPVASLAGETKPPVRVERVEYLERNYLKILAFFDDSRSCKDPACRAKVAEKHLANIDWTDVNIGGLNAIKELKVQAIRLELKELPKKPSPEEAKRKKVLLKALAKIEAEPDID